MLSIMHFGGYRNVLIPAYAILSIGFGLGLHSLISTRFLWNKIRGLTLNQKRLKIRRIIFLWKLTLLACLFQFCVLIYNPYKQIPTKEDEQAGYDLIAALENKKGEVFLPYHGYLPRMAGKQTYAHYMAIFDVLRSEDNSVAPKLSHTLEQSFREQKFDLIIIDEIWERGTLHNHYQLRKPILANPKVFYPVSGFQVRPEFCYVPIVKSNSSDSRQIHSIMRPIKNQAKKD